VRITQGRSRSRRDPGIAELEEAVPSGIPQDGTGG
jgi:hypothetical protein